MKTSRSLLFTALLVLLAATAANPTARAQTPAVTPAPASPKPVAATTPKPTPVPAMLFASPPPAADSSSTSPTQAQEKAAQVAAETWLTLLDEGKYPESWQTAASLFQAAIPQDKWVSQLGMVRNAFGKSNERKLRVIKYLTTVPGAPDGEYVVLQYESTFANKKNAIETITPMRDKDGAWKVSGYYIK